MPQIFLKCDFQHGSGAVLRAGSVYPVLWDRNGYCVKTDGEEMIIPTEICGHMDALDTNAFKFQRSLGEGAFGEVKAVSHPSTPGTLYAKKSIPIKSINDTKLYSEVRRLGQIGWLRHGVSFCQISGTATMLNIYMLPVAENNLAGFYESRARPTERTFGNDQDQILKWINCLTTTLALLHKADIVHRDIKPENLLIYRRDILFTDFGIANSRNDTSVMEKTRTEGTYTWMPPEAVNYENNNVYRAGSLGDVFSLGCVIYEMLEHSVPRELSNGVLPSRRDEILTYHMQVTNEGGLSGHVEKFIERSKRLKGTLNEEKRRQLELIEELLTIVARRMVVHRDQRASATEAASLIKTAMKNRKMVIVCCGEDI